MKVLFATTNPAKVKYYKDILENDGVELLTIKDLDFKLDVDENGKDAIENAYIKARAYYDATKIVSIGMDVNLYIEGLPEDKQPGTHIRRVNGKELSYEETLEYYTDLVKSYGGKMNAKYVYGLSVYDGVERKDYTYFKDGFYFIDKVCDTRNLGYPLDSITIVPRFNKYLAELSDDEKVQYNEVENKKELAANFVLDCLKNK